MFTYKPRLKNYIYELSENRKEIASRGMQFIRLSPDELIPVSVRATNASDSFMFKTDQGWMFFKTADDDELVSELLSAYIARQLGMNVVDPLPVEIEDMCGVVMPSYLPESRVFERYSFNDLHLKFSRLNERFKPQVRPTCFYAMTMLENLSEFGGTFAETKVNSEAMYDLAKIAIFDFLTRQTDRHSENIEFILEGGVLSVAPMFDNANSFFFDQSVLNAFRSEHWARSFTKAEIIKNLPLFGSDSDLRFKFTLPTEKIIDLKKGVDCEEKKSRPRCTMSIKDRQAESAKLNLEDISGVLYCNPKMQDFRRKIEYVNMQGIFDEIERDTGFKLSYKHKFVAENLFDNQRNILISATDKRAKEVEEKRQKNKTYVQTLGDESSK